jgi:2-polyprenyl-3-methyl-5-hydroxy-6-metoxy-1,4-benzoquinol methylase
MKNIIRTHDSFYLSENRYEDPKQLHLEIIGRIRAFLRNNKSLSKTSILDVGCAAGEFAYIL